MSVFAIFLLLSVSCFHSEAVKYPIATCTPAYQALMQYHTMCRYDSHRVEDWGVSASDIKIILDTHNNFRANTNPPAKEMPKLYWDKEVASVAEKWAKDCWWGHDTTKGRAVPGYPFIGQNMAKIPGAKQQWALAITLWYNETQDFEYGVGAKPEGAVIGHYTQVVLANTVRIGCGFANCGGQHMFYICNYVKGQTTDETKAPYKEGERCSGCPKSCKDGLCDCGGLVCLNGGSYNGNDCTCSCTGPWKGKDCSEPDCPKEDPESCKRKSSWHCKQYRATKAECPYLCGVCNNCGITCQNGGVLDPKSCKCDCGHVAEGDTCERKIQPCDGKVCQNGGKLATVKCSCLCRGWFEGETCSTAITTTTPAPIAAMVCPKDQSVTMLSADACKKLPTNGFDKVGICKSQGGSYDCSRCLGEWKSWFPRSYCPVMCGLCQPPCQGNVCHNGGTLGADCKCTCPTKSRYNDLLLVKFKGDLCEKVECPDSVAEEEAKKRCRCPSFKCDKGDNRFRCPFKCNVCRRP